MTERDTDGGTPSLDVPGPDSGPEHRTDRIDPTADGIDLERIRTETSGWGGGTMPPHELTEEQVEHLQDRPEPIGGGETGRTLHGDQGNADPIWQADAPETREPDTSLGHGGRGDGDPRSAS
jgi:hypothetical protein